MSKLNFKRQKIAKLDKINNKKFLNKLVLNNSNKIRQSCNKLIMMNLYHKYMKQIFILVSNPSEVKPSSMNKYLVYTVKGKDALGNFEVQRRFNEFYTLREALL